MRIGIVGTGMIAKTNVEALQKTGRVEIAALCNRTLSKGEDFAKAHGIALECLACHKANQIKATTCEYCTQ